MTKNPQSRITMNSPELSAYNGNPTLFLNPNGRASLGFGLGKAMVIVENLAAVMSFLRSDGKNLDVLTPEEKAEIEALAKRFLPSESGR